MTAGAAERAVSSLAARLAAVTVADRAAVAEATRDDRAYWDDLYAELADDEE